MLIIYLKKNLYKSINKKIRVDYNSFNIYNTNNSNSILGQHVHSGVDILIIQVILIMNLI